MPRQPSHLPQVEPKSTLDQVITSLRSILALLRPFRNPEAWKPLMLRGDWAKYDSEVPAAEYRKDPLGRVYLRGWVTSASGSSTLIAALPAGYRPSHYVDVPVTENTQVGNYVRVFPDGQILLGYLSPGSAVSLDNVSFMPE